MKALVLGIALLSGAAVAQIPGAGQGVGATIGEGLNAQAPVGQTIGNVNSSVRAIDERARDSARDASDRASRAADKRVQAQAGVRVARETRCYDTSGDFDPWYRDGYYYCERSGTSVGAGASVKTPG